MALTIRTTGLEDYIDDGSNIRELIIGGPGVGKTRSSSYWPRPIYADCESGRASVADRKVAYAEIKGSQDMLEFLAQLKAMESTPKAQRKYQTVVIDTLDGFQRKVKDEWLQQTKSQSFKGYDAWGYLDSKMQMLMTRLLNLDLNVIVLVHYKDKKVTDSEGNESREIILQLQGDIATTAFNDFDLVGWMGSYWEAENGQRVEKRGLTFTRTPEKPFLKDRFGVMPNWVPITFSDSDYSFIFDAFVSRIESLTAGEVVEEFPTVGPEAMVPGAGVVAPAASGALPVQDPKDVPLSQFDKPTLVRMAKELGLRPAGNALKGELISLIEVERARAATLAKAAAVRESDASPASAVAASTPTVTATPETATAQQSVVAPTPDPAGTTTSTAMPETAAAPQVVVIPSGETVDVRTGEVITVTEEKGLENAQHALGGEVISQVPAVDTAVVAATPPTPEPAPAQAQQADLSAHPCQWPTGCDNGLNSPDHARLSRMKWKLLLCEQHFMQAKADGIPKA